MKTVNVIEFNKNDPFIDNIVSFPDTEEGIWEASNLFSRIVREIISCDLCEEDIYDAINDALSDGCFFCGSRTIMIVHSIEEQEFVNTF